MDSLPKNRKTRADLAHAYGGGVSTPSPWQFGFGKTGRLLWPPSPPLRGVGPRRGGRAKDNEAIARRDCERSSRRGICDGCVQMPESVESREDSGGRSGRAPSERPASSRGVIDPGGKRGRSTTVSGDVEPAEKKMQSKPTDEMRNTLCDRRNDMVNKVFRG